VNRYPLLATNIRKYSPGPTLTRAWWSKATQSRRWHDHGVARKEIGNLIGVATAFDCAVTTYAALANEVGSTKDSPVGPEN